MLQLVYMAEIVKSVRPTDVRASDDCNLASQVGGRHLEVGGEEVVVDKAEHGGAKLIRR